MNRIIKWGGAGSWVVTPRQPGLIPTKLKGAFQFTENVMEAFNFHGHYLQLLSTAALDNPKNSGNTCSLSASGPV